MPLTDKSLTIINNLFSMSDETREKFLAGLDDDEQNFLTRILEKYETEGYLERNFRNEEDPTPNP